MNYFEFYELPVSFILNEATVKQKFLELSRRYHPDFFISQPGEKQKEILELSTLNTRAYNTLRDFDLRMKYVLQLRNLIHDGERYELPPVFLMEMIDLNEELMEMKQVPDTVKITSLKNTVQEMLSQLYSKVKAEIENYNDEKAGEEALKKIKEYYYMKRYLLRLKESLDTFGAP